MKKRKQFFLTLNGLRLHLSRTKNTWEVTCFDALTEEGDFLNKNKEFTKEKSRAICNYLSAEGFVEPGDIVVVISPESEDEPDWS